MARNNEDNVRLHVWCDPDTKRRLAALANQADVSLNCLTSTILSYVARQGKVGSVHVDGELTECMYLLTVAGIWERTASDRVFAKQPVLEMDLESKSGKFLGPSSVQVKETPKNGSN